MKTNIKINKAGHGIKSSFQPYAGKIYSLVAILGLLVFSLSGMFLPVFSKEFGSSFFNFNGGNFSLPSFNLDFLSGIGSQIKGEVDGRTNILILGSDYGNIHDTNIFLTLNHKDKKITATTIPRDLTVVVNTEEVKINSLWNNTAFSSDSDAEKMLKVVNYYELLISQKIHYYSRVNIAGVIAIIDKLGGVEIDVENSFSDCEFPNADFTGYLTPCPSFKQGKKIMDSKEAIVFARSRKSYDNPQEALDFARSKRQTKIIEAIIAKLESKVQKREFGLNLDSMTLLLDISNTKTDSNITNWELLAMGRKLLDKSQYPALMIEKRIISMESGIVCETPGTSYLTLCDDSIVSPNNKSPMMGEFTKQFQ
jgi:LCP family protein required for cell wall assembly